MIQGNIPDLYTPLFDEVTLAVYAKQPSQLEKVFDNRTDNSSQVDVSSVSGLGIWEKVEEGIPITQEDPVQMYNQSFVHVEFGKSFNVTFKALKNDEYAILKKVDNATALGEGALIRTETERGDLFNNAFSSSYLGADGVALCSNSHPKNPDESSTLYDNYLTNGFSHDGLEAMELLISQNLKNPKGNIIPIPKAAYLVHGWTITGKVDRVLSERAGLRPGTAENDINIYSAGKGHRIAYTPLLSEYISGSAWFVVFPSLKGLRFYWREKPHYDSYIDHALRRYVFDGAMEFSLGWTGDGWRSIWGSDAST